MAQLNYYAHGKHLVTTDEQLVYHGNRVNINGITYRVVGNKFDSGIQLELYSFPTTLTAYLLMLHSMTEAQYLQWLRSLSTSQWSTVQLRYYKPTLNVGVQAQLTAYQCTVDCGTIVYYNLDRWEAYNADYQASATASTLAELLNTWAEATEHVSYDSPE